MQKDITEWLKEFPTLVKLAVLGDAVSAQAIATFSRDALLEIQALRADKERLEKECEALEAENDQCRAAVQS